MAPRGLGNNPRGNNQFGGKLPPLDDDIKEILRGYYNKGIVAYDELRLRLNQEHGIKIGRSSLAKWLQQTGLSYRKANGLTEDQQKQTIIDYLEYYDSFEQQGPKYVKSELKAMGVHIPRPTIEQVMRATAPEGFEKRDSRNKSKKIERVPLYAIGPHDEWSADGHDKMMQEGFAIYGIRDKWGGKFMRYEVMPSNRWAANAAVVYLRCVKQEGGIPIQLTTDYGSETVKMFGLQKALRAEFAPQYSEEELPSYSYTDSRRNITVERGWRPLFYKWGTNVVVHYRKGRFEGDFFDEEDKAHQQIANWIWFPLVQRELDDWCTRQYYSRVPQQPEKTGLPSGGTRESFYRDPKSWGAARDDCLIHIPEATIDQLLEKAEAEAAEHLEFVDEEHDALATEAYAAIGKPAIKLDTAWGVFQQIINVINAPAEH